MANRNAKRIYTLLELYNDLSKNYVFGWCTELCVALDMILGGGIMQLLKDVRGVISALTSRGVKWVGLGWA